MYGKWSSTVENTYLDNHQRANAIRRYVTYVNTDDQFVKHSATSIWKLVSYVRKANECALLLYVPWHPGVLWPHHKHMSMNLEVVNHDLSIRQNTKSLYSSAFTITVVGKMDVAQSSHLLSPGISLVILSPSSFSTYCKYEQNGVVLNTKWPLITLYS